MAKARYVMIGGFLGAGKTTAVLRIAERLAACGLRVGLITNDQSFGLVDTTMLHSHGFPVEEITGGCFCCKFNSLVDASEKLSLDARPDVFLAEPVGSCTDLKATVSYPLRRMYGDNFAIAPLSVMVDPVRALRILGLEAGKAFSPKVVYIYTKQLEEAEIIVVNKCDLLTPERLEILSGALRERFPRATVLQVSARYGTGLDEWIAQIGEGELGIAATMDVDYDLYAEGEALLGWLNFTAQLTAPAPFDGNQVVRDLAVNLHRRLEDLAQEIAHLKMTLTPSDAGNDLAVLNLVRNDHEPELAFALEEPIESGQLIVNLRAEADPQLLRTVALAALETVRQAAGIDAAIEHIESFQPGRPQPTHRLEVAR